MEDLYKTYNICTCIGSCHLFGSMEEDEECDCDQILIDGPSAQGGDKKNYSVGEDNSKTCKDVVIKMKWMYSQVKHDLHEDLELQSEPWHALDVPIDEHENVEMPSQFNVKSIVACVEVGESRIFKSIHVSQLNGNPTLFKDWLAWNKTYVLYVRPKHLTATNYDTMLNLGCDYGLCLMNTPEARIVKKKCGRPKDLALIKDWFVGRVHRMRR